MTLREKQESRTDQQNRYYHSVVIKMISEQTGDTPDDTHEHMKTMFNGGESTTKLKTKEFAEYLAAIKVWAAEFHSLPIPDPDQVDY